MNASSTTAVTAVIAAAVLALSACGATSSPASGVGTTTPATSVTTSAASPMMSSGSAAAMPIPAAPAGPHNQADITFAQQMTIPHQGAIAMATWRPPAQPSARSSLWPRRSKRPRHRKSPRWPVGSPRGPRAPT